VNAPDNDEREEGAPWDDGDPQASKSQSGADDLADVYPCLHAEAAGLARAEEPTLSLSPELRAKLSELVTCGRKSDAIAALAADFAAARRG